MATLYRNTYFSNIMQKNVIDVDGDRYVKVAEGTREELEVKRADLIAKDFLTLIRD